MMVSKWGLFFHGSQGSRDEGIKDKGNNDKRLLRRRAAHSEESGGRRQRQGRIGEK